MVKQISLKRVLLLTICILAVASTATFYSHAGTTRGDEMKSLTVTVKDADGHSGQILKCFYNWDLDLRDHYDNGPGVVSIDQEDYDAVRAYVEGTGPKPPFLIGHDMGSIHQFGVVDGLDASLFQAVLTRQIKTGYIHSDYADPNSPLIEVPRREGYDPILCLPFFSCSEVAEEGYDTKQVIINGTAYDLPSPGLDDSYFDHSAPNGDWYRWALPVFINDGSSKYDDFHLYLKVSERKSKNGDEVLHRQVSVGSDPTGKEDFYVTENATIEFVHEISDTTGPVINAQDKEVDKGTSLEDAIKDFTAEDDEDGPVDVYVKDDGGYDPNTPGEYTVIIGAKDKAGNESTKEVKITVKDNGGDNGGSTGNGQGGNKTGGAVSPVDKNLKAHNAPRTDDPFGYMAGSALLLSLGAIGTMLARRKQMN